MYVIKRNGEHQEIKLDILVKYKLKIISILCLYLFKIDIIKYTYYILYNKKYKTKKY